MFARPGAPVTTLARSSPASDGICHHTNHFADETGKEPAEGEGDDQEEQSQTKQGHVFEEVTE